MILHIILLTIIIIQPTNPLNAIIKSTALLSNCAWTVGHFLNDMVTKWSHQTIDCASMPSVQSSLRDEPSLQIRQWRWTTVYSCCDNHILLIYIWIAKDQNAWDVFFTRGQLAHTITTIYTWYTQGKASKEESLIWKCKWVHVRYIANISTSRNTHDTLAWNGKGSKNIKCNISHHPQECNMMHGAL